MSDQILCAICGCAAAEPVSRPLVPRELLAEMFDLDPLGTGGAEAQLCRSCADVLAMPMLTGEDLEAFARAAALHKEAHPPADERDERAARARLFHRAIHLGMLAVVTELSERPPAPPVRPDPDQLGLFVSKTQRLAKVEQALAEADLAQARALAEDLVRRFDLKEARFLAATLPQIEGKIAPIRDDAEALAFLAAGPEGALEKGRITVSLTNAFHRGLHRLVAMAAERDGLSVVLGRPVGWYWMRAAEPELARASLETSASAGHAPGQSLMLLGNLAHQRGDVEGARALYRKALEVDPQAVFPDEIVDSEVQDLFAQARSRGLAPAEAVVRLGEEQGIFVSNPAS